MNSFCLNLNLIFVTRDAITNVTKSFVNQQIPVYTYTCVFYREIDEKCPDFDDF